MDFIEKLQSKGFGATPPNRFCLMNCEKRRFTYDLIGYTELLWQLSVFYCVSYGMTKVLAYRSHNGH